MTTQKIKIGTRKDFEDGKTKVFELDGKHIGVANAEGNFWAFDDICTHDGGTLADGEIFDTDIECPRHGAHFDMKTGKALTLPAVKSISVYPVVVEGEDIYVEVP